MLADALPGAAAAIARAARGDGLLEWHEACDAGEVERLWAANAKARELFGWRPAYGGLEGFKRGVAETVDWFVQAQNLNGYKADIYNL